MSTGTVFLWMTSAQYLEVKRYSLVRELAEVCCRFFPECFWYFLFFKCLLCLFSPSLIPWCRNVIKSCEIRERIIKRLKLWCMNLQTKPLRMSIFPVCWPQTFHQKHIFACQVTYYLLVNFFNADNFHSNEQGRKSMFWTIWKNYGYSWQWCFGQLICFNTAEQSWLVYQKEHWVSILFCF